MRSQLRNCHRPIACSGSAGMDREQRFEFAVAVNGQSLSPPPLPQLASLRSFSLRLLFSSNHLLLARRLSFSGSTISSHAARVLSDSCTLEEGKGASGATANRFCREASCSSAEAGSHRVRIILLTFHCHPFAGFFTRPCNPCLAKSALLFAASDVHPTQAC